MVLNTVTHMILKHTTIVIRCYCEDYSINNIIDADRNLKLWSILNKIQIFNLIAVIILF